MTAKKNDRVQCMIERFQKEVPGENDRYFKGFIQGSANDLIRYYCFPVLFSALFYDPTPEQLRYIGNQADQMAVNYRYFNPKDSMRAKPLRVENMMRLAAYEVGTPDFQYWRDTLVQTHYNHGYRALLICGSAHPNGYLREQCVQHFSEPNLSGLLAYTYPRLNDWVPAVRRAAANVLAELMKNPKAGSAFIDAMPCRMSLRRRERVHREPAFSIDALDEKLMQFVEADPQHVLKGAAGSCYKLFAMHPDPKYRGLILHFYRREHSGELRCLLERIYIRMTDAPIPAKVLELFMQDNYVHARLIAYDYRFKQEGIWDGFDQLLLSPSRRIRDFASNRLKPHGFDFLTYARNNLPESLPLLGNFGTEEDIPLVRPYLETHPAEAMYALAKLGAADSKSLILNNMQSNDKKLSKAAYRLARSLKCFEADELLPRIAETADSLLRYRLTLLLTKDGVWSAMPYLIRALKDDPDNHWKFLYIIKKYIGVKVDVSAALNKEIVAALAYINDGNYIPNYVNNQIFSDIQKRY